MFDSYERTHSFFENSPLKAEGTPGPEELALLEPLRDKVPEEVFGEAFVPPVSDGSGRDRAMLQKASELLDGGGLQARGRTACSRPTARPSPSSSSTTIQPSSRTTTPTSPA